MRWGAVGRSAALGLAGLAACEADFEFVGPPDDPAEHRWYAVREGNQAGWWLEARDPATRPLLVPPESSVIVLDFAVDPGLPRDRRLNRGDLGTASCELMQPARVRTLSLSDGPSWREVETPEVLTRILRGLAENRCHRCVRFEEQRLVQGTLETVEPIETLASGAALAWVGRTEVVRANPGEDIQVLTGCGPRPAQLVRSGRPNEFYAVRGSSLYLVSVDEAAGLCTTRTATAVPGVALVRVAVSGSDEPFEAFVLSQEGDETSGELRLTLHRVTELGVETLLTSALNLEGEADVLRLGPGDALISTGFERLVRWRQGSSSELRTPQPHAIKGLTRVPPTGPFLAFTQALAVEAAVHELNPSTGALRTLGRLGDRARDAAPFRGGFVTVTRAGSVLEYGDGEFCPESTTLGNLMNHAPNHLRAAPGDGLYLDAGETILSLLRPLPPEPPAETEF